MSSSYCGGTFKYIALCSNIITGKGQWLEERWNSKQQTHYFDEKHARLKPAPWNFHNNTTIRSPATHFTIFQSESVQTSEGPRRLPPVTLFPFGAKFVGSTILVAAAQQNRINRMKKHYNGYSMRTRSKLRNATYKRTSTLRAGDSMATSTYPRREDFKWG